MWTTFTKVCRSINGSRDTARNPDLKGGMVLAYPGSQLEPGLGTDRFNLTQNDVDREIKVSKSGHRFVCVGCLDNNVAAVTKIVRDGMTRQDIPVDYQNSTMCFI